MDDGVRFRVEPGAVPVPDQVLAGTEHQAGRLLPGHAHHNRGPRRSRGAEPFVQVRCCAASRPELRETDADPGRGTGFTRVPPDGQAHRRAGGSLGVCRGTDGDEIAAFSSPRTNPLPLAHQLLGQTSPNTVITTSTIEICEAAGP